MTCSNSDHFIRMRARASGELLTEPPFCHPEPFDWAQDKLRERSRFTRIYELLRRAQSDDTGMLAVL
jgi:hypothetical protein